ncbi:hypothetical protein FB451DRAFT_1313541 [Mycena latifolia]|nr:hypothetical protein FB451DRAFT_1313541 [Mycena latifolia]
MSYGGQQQYGGGGYGAPPPPHGGGGYGPPPGGPPGHGGYGPPPGGPPGGAGGYGAPGGGYGAGGHAGGFAPPAGHGPPPGADPQLWSWFTSVDTDRSGAITAVELERALINGDWTPFDLDTVKLLMTIFDTDRSGTIGFNEFAGLWKYIKDWQNVFKHFDRDRSGSIDLGELRDALAQFGYNLSPGTLQLVQRKYGEWPRPPSPPPARRLPRAHAPPRRRASRSTASCARASSVKQLSEAFGRLDTDRDGWIQIGYEGFMETVLSLP